MAIDRRAECGPVRWLGERADGVVVAPIRGELIMWFGILGPLQVHDGERPVEVPAVKLRAILAVLLTRAGQVAQAGVLADLVWDGVPPEGAASTLRSHVMRLRRALGPRAGARLVTRYPGYLIQAGSDEVDLLRFSALGQDCGAAACAGAWEQVAGLAGEALGLWRGEPLADIASPMLVRAEVPQLERLRLQLLEWDAEAGLQLGRHRELVPGLQELVAVHRLHERFHALLMPVRLRL